MSCLSSLIHSEIQPFQRARYEKHPWERVSGFVVNVYDAINLDIDLELTSELKTRYGNVYVNKYDYVDVGVAIDNILSDRVRSEEQITSNTYRCHLYGLKLHRELRGSTRQPYAIAKMWLARTQGNVVVEVGDIDVFSRILVKVYDPVTNECLNDLLLKYETSVTDYHSSR